MTQTITKYYVKAQATFKGVQCTVNALRYGYWSITARHTFANPKTAMNVAAKALKTDNGYDVLTHTMVLVSVEEIVS